MRHYPLCLASVGPLVLACALAGGGLVAGCSVIVDGELNNRDAGSTGPSCTTDRNCISLDPRNCMQSCVDGVCQAGVAAPDGTSCGEAGMSICVAGFCEVSTCGDMYVDRVSTPREYCDDGADGDPNNGCNDNCTRACGMQPDGTTAPNCNDGDSCSMEECVGPMLMQVCRVMEPMDDGAPCNSRTVTDGVCERGRCVAP